MSPSFFSEFNGLVFHFIRMLILSPMIAYWIVSMSDLLVNSWKSGNRKKKWIAVTYAIIGAYLIMGLI